VRPDRNSRPKGDPSAQSTRRARSATGEKAILSYANEQAGAAVTTDALVFRRRDAAEEKERILTAAVRVMSRAAPQAPKVSDIISEAGTCNKTFYRYFGGKDDLVLAVMERGIGKVAAYLDAQMGAQADPAAKVARWVEGLLEQVTDPYLFSMCYATVAQMSSAAHRKASDDETMTPIRVLLNAPIVALGRTHPDRDADAVFHCTMGTLRRYLGSGELPPAADVDHLVRFCLNGIGVRVGEATYT
jgi:AcrR family transcriptional regulator